MKNMKKSEYIKEYGKDLTELKITSVLNASIYGNMSDDEKEKFIKNNVSELAKRFIDRDWSDIVNVRCEYKVVDSYLQIKGYVEAYLDYSHRTGVVNCTFKETKV